MCSVAQQGRETTVLLYVLLLLLRRLFGRQQDMDSLQVVCKPKVSANAQAVACYTYDAHEEVDRLTQLLAAKEQELQAERAERDLAVAIGEEYQQQLSSTLAQLTSTQAQLSSTQAQLQAAQQALCTAHAREAGWRRLVRLVLRSHVQERAEDAKETRDLQDKLQASEAKVAKVQVQLAAAAANTEKQQHQAAAMHAALQQQRDAATQRMQAQREAAAKATVRGNGLAFAAARASAEHATTLQRLAEAEQRAWSAAACVVSLNLERLQVEADNLKLQHCCQHLTRWVADEYTMRCWW